MPITLASASPVAQGVDGRVRWKVWQVNGPASYTTGGTAFTPSEVAMSRIFWTEALTPFYNGTLMVTPQFPPVSADGSQLMLFGETGTAVDVPLKQANAADNLSTYTGLIKVYGT